MKRRYLVLIFATSVGVGWAMRPGASGKNLPQLVKAPPSPRLRQEREVRPAKTARVDQVLALNQDDQFTFCKNISSQDRAALIDLILKEGDPNGISSESSSMMYMILDKWVAEDFTSAWAWCQQIENANHKRYIAGELLNHFAKKDLTRALDLHLEMSLADPLFNSRVPSLALEDAASKTAGDLLNVLAKLPSDHGMGSSANFAKDFDFQQVAEGLDALQKKQGKSRTRFPYNFIETWAARDPDAAFSWFVGLSTTDRIYLGRFDDLIEGLGTQGIPGAVSTWMAGKIETSETFRTLIAGEMKDASPATINGIVKALPNSNSSDRFLTELFLQQCSSPWVELTTSLAGMSSPQVRINALSQAKKNGSSPRDGLSATQYQALDITQAQFEEVFPPDPDNSEANKLLYDRMKLIKRLIR